jgi:hypothetical protein
MPTEVRTSADSSRPLTSRQVLELEAALRGGPTALVMDLEPLLGVRLAADLSHRARANVVLVLPRWPHPRAILPTESLIAALLGGAENLKAGRVASDVVFILDGERTTSVRRTTLDARVDNRYDLAVGDLPNLEQLRAAGIQRVVKLSHAPKS